MRFAAWRWCAVTSLFVAAGCVLPPHTRLPTLQPRDPRLERRLYEFHDPFPDDALGPETNQRPPSFNTPRTAPRRALEFQMLQGLQQQQQQPQPDEPGGPRLPRRQWSYPDSVPH